MGLAGSQDPVCLEQGLEPGGHFSRHGLAARPSRREHVNTSEAAAGRREPRTRPQPPRPQCPGTLGATLDSKLGQEGGLQLPPVRGPLKAPRRMPPRRMPPPGGPGAQAAGASGGVQGHRRDGCACLQPAMPSTPAVANRWTADMVVREVRKVGNRCSRRRRSWAHRRGPLPGVMGGAGRGRGQSSLKFKRDMTLPGGRAGPGSGWAVRRQVCTRGPRQRGLRSGAR